MSCIYLVDCFGLVPLQSPGPFSFWPADGTLRFLLLPASFAFFISFLLCPHPHTLTLGKCVSPGKMLLEVTSCLTRGTEGREKTGLHCFRLRRSCLVFSANTSARDTIPLDADPTFYHDVRLTFASMLLPFAVLGNSVLVILPFLFNMKIFLKNSTVWVNRFHLLVFKYSTHHAESHSPSFLSQ